MGRQIKAPGAGTMLLILLVVLGLTLAQPDPPSTVKLWDSPSLQFLIKCGHVKGIITSDDFPDPSVDFSVWEDGMKKLKEHICSENTEDVVLYIERNSCTPPYCDKPEPTWNAKWKPKKYESSDYMNQDYMNQPRTPYTGYMNQNQNNLWTMGRMRRF